MQESPNTNHTRTPTGLDNIPKGYDPLSAFEEKMGLNQMAVAVPPSPPKKNKGGRPRKDRSTVDIQAQSEKAQKSRRQKAAEFEETMVQEPEVTVQGLEDIYHPLDDQVGESVQGDVKLPPLEQDERGRPSQPLSSLDAVVARTSRGKGLVLFKRVLHTSNTLEWTRLTLDQREYIKGRVEELMTDYAWMDEKLAVLRRSRYGNAIGVNRLAYFLSAMAGYQALLDMDLMAESSD